MKKTKITYLGHSCFLLEKDGFLLCIDPYCRVCGLPDVSVGANEVVCTHSHFDHAYVEGVLRLLNLVENPFDIEKISVSHDENNGKDRGKSDILLLESEGLRISHFGDIGCMPESEVLKKLEGLDVAMIPIGGVYTIGAKTAKKIIDIIKPKIVLPMHYKIGDKGFDNLAPLSDFAKLFDEIIELKTNCLEIPSEKRGVVVLRF